MATHDAWALVVCRLFAGGTPVLRATLSPREVSALSMLGKAVRPTVTVDQFLCSAPTVSSIGRRSGAMDGAVGSAVARRWTRFLSRQSTVRRWPWTKNGCGRNAPRARHREPRRHR